LSCEAGHDAVAADQAEQRALGGDVVGELVEAPVGPEVVVEGGREHERVGDQQAARVVADEQRRLADRDVLQPLDLAAEVGPADRLQPRQGAADVLRVPGVDRVGGEALDQLLGVGQRAGRVLDQPVERGGRVAGQAAEGVHP
jgi:hypothetical protein